MATKVTVPVSTLVQRDQVDRAAVALKQFENKRNPLHDDDDTGVFLGLKRNQVNLHPFIQPKLFEVPHPIQAKNPKICLFLKDFDENDKLAKKLHADLKLNLDKVLTHSKLKKKYSGYENLRQLASRFDLFLADKRIVRAAYSVLGRTFSKKAHKPFGVTVEGKTLQEILTKIERAKKSAVYLDANGPTTSIKVAQVGFTSAQITDNVLAAVKAIETRFENWDNLLHLYIKTPSSPSLTIHQVMPDVSDIKTDDKSNDKKSTASPHKRSKKGKPDLSNPKADSPKKNAVNGKQQNGKVEEVKKGEEQKGDKKEVTTPKKEGKKNAKENGATPQKAEPKTPPKSGKKNKKAATPQKEESVKENGNKKRKIDEPTAPETPKAAKSNPQASPKQPKQTPKPTPAPTTPSNKTVTPAPKTPTPKTPTPAPKVATPAPKTPTPKTPATPDTPATPETPKEQKSAKKRKAADVETTPAPAQKKSIATPKATPKETPKETPKATPKATPKVAPKASPKATPKATPKAKTPSKNAK